MIGFSIRLSAGDADGSDARARPAVRRQFGAEHILEHSEARVPEPRRPGLTGVDEPAAGFLEDITAGLDALGSDCQSCTKK